MEKMKRLEQQNVDIRPLEPQDIQELVKNFTFPEIGLEKTQAKWQTYYKEHEAGERLVCLLVKDTKILGYGSLLPESTYEPFEQDEIFEIADIWVAPSERRQGLATLLISYFEYIVQDEGATLVGMSFGVDALHAPAHTLAIQLGYLPDDQGMTYQGIPVTVGKQYRVDDDLRLWFVKDLATHEHDE